MVLRFVTSRSQIHFYDTQTPHQPHCPLGRCLTQCRLAGRKRAHDDHLGRFSLGGVVFVWSLLAGALGVGAHCAQSGQAIQKPRGRALGGAARGKTGVLRRYPHHFQCHHPRHFRAVSVLDFAFENPALHRYSLVCRAHYHRGALVCSGLSGRLSTRQAPLLQRTHSVCQYFGLFLGRHCTFIHSARQVALGVYRGLGCRFGRADAHFQRQSAGLGGGGATLLQRHYSHWRLDYHG